jgi:hypothetical protein
MKPEPKSNRVRLVVLDVDQGKGQGIPRMVALVRTRSYVSGCAIMRSQYADDLAILNI